LLVHVVNQLVNGGTTLVGVHIPPSFLSCRASKRHAIGQRVSLESPQGGPEVLPGTVHCRPLDNRRRLVWPVGCP
jgi:hypothetical protein